MAVVFSVTFLGVIGILEATFVLVWLLVRLQSEREKRLRQGEEEQDERPNSAWLRSLAAEDLPRCEFCLNAGLGEAAIGHTVYDESGEVSCPVLQKRREKLLRRDDSPSAHDAAGQEVEIEEAEVETKAGTSAEALTGGREHGKERDGVESEAAAKRRRKAQALQERVNRETAVRKGQQAYLLYDPYASSP